MNLRFPDFICIGAQKAGTTWLHAVLRQHPDIWLPPFKEIQYFNRLEPHKRNVSEAGFTAHDERRRDNMLKAMKAVLKGTKPADQKLDRVYCLSLIARAEQTDEWYGRIFANAPGSAVCGEISPDYALLSDAGIEHVLRLRPDVKLIFLLRDPIERSWSYLRMSEERGHATNRERISGRPSVAYSDYMPTIGRYRCRVSADRFLVVFFDDIVAAPNEFLRNICSFLGVDSSRASFRKTGDPVNVGQHKPMDPDMYAEYRDVFAPIYERLLQLDHPIVYQWYEKHYGKRAP